EGGGEDGPGVPAQQRQLLTGPRVPEPGGVVIAGRQHAVAVGTEQGLPDRSALLQGRHRRRGRHQLVDAGGGGRGGPAPTAPAGLKQAWWTDPACVSGGVKGRPLPASQTRAVLSSLAVTRRVPSGLKATRLTAL